MPVDSTQADALALRDIHLPEPVSWWPPAPGWWLLAGLLIIITTGYFLWRKLKQRKRLQKSAQAELDSIRARYLDDNDRYALVQSLSILLRRACVSFYPRTSSASLTGQQWLDFLDKTSHKAAFKKQPGAILATAPYLPQGHAPDIDAEALLAVCEDWLRVQPVKQPDTESERG